MVYKAKRVETDRSRHFVITWNPSDGQVPTDEGATIHEIALVLLERMKTVSEMSAPGTIHHATEAMVMVVECLTESAPAKLEPTPVASATATATEETVLPDPFEDPLA